ncbi:MalY/PatB family protein [Deinococcus pimensis]|uniref:MalY/PatB family protein n=1 Tax=Deinococcus pimensis TaxID=309888 RepID=UPI000484EE10|nr:PatB family C-S lyase [Deinococcus pimensis]
MSHPFDALTHEVLRHDESVKWATFGTDVLPLWIADMDFPVASEVREALLRRVEGPLGYGLLAGDPRLYALVNDKEVARGSAPYDPAAMMLMPGVVPGLYAAVLGLTSPGDEIVTHVPIYPPFLSAIADHGRVTRAVPLTAPGGDAARWEIDWDAMEAAVTPRTRLLMLCSPHNPTGRVWSREELARLAEFALRHRLWVVSDELHADLVLDGTFVPFASVSPEVARRTVTLTGPCKTYNTAALGIGLATSHEPALIDAMRAATKGVMGHPAALAQTAWMAGLSSDGAWLADVLGYLRANRDHLVARVARDLPGVRFTPPEATYLAWLDFSALGWDERPQVRLLERARVGLSDGLTFGEGYGAFARLNFATSRAVLDEAVDRLTDAVREASPVS